MSYYTLLTSAGQDLLTQAMGMGQQIELISMAVGDGNGAFVAPSESQTALVNEVYRAGVASLTVDDENSNWLVAELVIPTDQGGFTIREIGLFDVDGNLFAVGNFPETYKPALAEGSGREITVRMTIQVSDTATVTLTIDQSVVFATRTYVHQKIQEHEQSRNHPDATTTAKGFVELATVAEATAGSSSTHSVTPAGLKAHVDSRLASYDNAVKASLDALRRERRQHTYFMGQN
jgi:phage-related tail fiber protein